MNKNILLQIIGTSCKAWRLTMDYKLTQVAEETGYTPASITFFECGASNNLAIFAWYLAHGFNPDNDLLNLDGSNKHVGMFDVYEYAKGIK